MQKMQENVSSSNIAAQCLDIAARREIWDAYRQSNLALSKRLERSLVEKGYLI
jgi:hypothetical protein